MASKKVTMTDIAKKIGLSQATVSIVLNGKGDKRIAPETCDLVIKTAQNMGYSPLHNRMHNFSDFILYVTDDISTSQMAPYLINGAQEAASENNKNLVILTNLLDHQEDLEASLKLFSPHSVILASSILREVEVSKIVRKYNVILLNCIDTLHNLPSIMPDDRFGAQEACEYLITNGCKKIACITGDSWMMATQNRLEGYKLALMTNNLHFDATLIYTADWDLKKAYDATMQILKDHKDIDAIFSFGDIMSQSIYLALNEKGLKVGKDIHVISFDNHDTAAQLVPPLSSVDLPHEKMGKLAVDFLVQEHPNLLGSRIVIPCHFVKRQSSKPKQKL